MSPRPEDYAACRVPLRRLQGAFDITITVHEGIAEDVWEADRRWRALGGPAFFKVRQSDTGSYNCRPSKAHSRALAIDFNWSDQGMHSRTRPGSDACRQLPGMKEFYRKCWAPLGYGWGANWRSKCDAMHVSKLVSEGGDGVLYRTWDAREEDDLPYSEADLKRIIREVITEETIYPKAKDDEPKTLADHVRKAFAGLYDRDEAGKIVQANNLILGSLGVIARRLTRIANHLDVPDEGGQGG